MTRFAAISIDLDDTLWPIAPVIERAERALHDWLMEHCPRIALNGAGHLGSVRRRILERYPERMHDFAFLRKAGIGLLLEDAGYDLELVETAYQVFFDARNEVDLYDDVMPALEILSERYVLLAVTNGSADLDRVGLHELFDHHVRAADVGVAKPGAEIFNAAARAAGVAPGQVLHVGDAPLEDVGGAHQAGMQAVWVNRFGRTWPEDHPPPMAEIEGIHELHRLLSED